MKKLLFFALALVISQAVHSQDYVDVVKLAYSNATLGNIDNNRETDLDNINLEVYYPKEINDKVVLLTGFTAENNRLDPFQLDNRDNITMTRLNLGAKLKHSEKWSGTYMLLPKLASDFNGITGQDFQMGALALLDYQYTQALKLKFGLYASTENFGTTLTPLLGLWYRSKNKKFYINATLPIRADMNYALTKKFSLGADLLTSVKSYNINENDSERYIQEESIRAALYASYGFLDNALLVRAKVGYDTTDFGVYNQGDEVGVQVLTFQVGGDDRNRLNSEFNAGMYLGAELIYRFDLSKLKQ